MKIHARIGCFLLLLLLAVTAVARDSSDVIVMKNGDHLTGEIKGLEQGVLYISMNYILGTSQVQWSKVDHIESTQLFLVKTESRKRLHGNPLNRRSGKRHADDNRSGGVVEQTDASATARGSGDGTDIGEILAPVQRGNQQRNYLYEGQSIDAVQPEFGRHVSTGAMVGGHVVQLEPVDEYWGDGDDAQPADVFGTER